MGRAEETVFGVPLVQRFESQEHQDIGNTATGGATVSVGGELPHERLVLTHGEVIALSGDWFRPDDSVPDGLFHLARIPGRGGGGVGTRDEIFTALLVYKEEEDQRRAEERRRGGNPPAPLPGASSVPPGFVPTADVRKKVKDRYRSLAADNTPHFVAPRGRDPAAGAIVPPAVGETNAELTYRSLHEAALSRAHALGRAGGDISHAMAMEAAAQHFLTDAFSAGHVRTPVAQIREFWRAKYPLFWFNLQHKIALDTASRMNADDNNLATALGTVQTMYEEILRSIQQVTANYPELSLGDLIAKMFHDFDNIVGIDAGGGQRVFGDHQLRLPRGDNVTLNLAVQAVQAGNRDVTQAYALGRAGAELAGEALFSAVRAATSATGSQYVAESKIPVPAAGTRPQSWMAANFETLWDQPMEAGGTYRVADMAAFELNPGSEIFQQLVDLEQSFPKEQPVVVVVNIGTLHPRQAYHRGFLEPLVNNPLRGILETIHWSPSQGDLRSVDRDDVALDTGQELDRSGQLPGMTTPARVEYVRQLIDGSVGDDEEVLVMRIFESAAAGERPEIYRLVEGHAWTGHFIRGILTRDDDLVDALSNDRLDTLTKLINEGVRQAHEARPTPTTQVPTIYDAQHEEISGAAARRPGPQAPADRGLPVPPPSPLPNPACPAGPTPHPTLRLGASGEAVSEIQCKLTEAGRELLPLRADGLFGARTKGGVAAFQHSEGLDVDGKAGPGTWAALDDRTGAPPAAHRLLAKGAAGKSVKELQDKLNTVGEQPIPLADTSSFTELEEGATVAFQDSESLITDGVVGAATWASVDEVTSP